MVRREREGGRRKKENKVWWGSRVLRETSITVLSDCRGMELSKRSSGLFLCTVGTWAEPSCFQMTLGSLSCVGRLLQQFDTFTDSPVQCTGKTR